MLRAHAQTSAAGMASTGMSLREKYHFNNTLGCLVSACVGYETTVDLRDESSVKGFIENVDGYMNITIKDAVYEKVDGTVHRWETLFVTANKVRFVHIPDEIDMRMAIQKHVRQNFRSSKVTGKRKYKAPTTKEQNSNAAVDDDSSAKFDGKESSVNIT